MGHLEESPGDSNEQCKEDSVIEVLSVSIDELAYEGELPIPSCLKIDVEGGEAGVLRGSNANIAEAHPTILLAIHGQEVGQECLSFLETAGYALKPIGQNNPDGCDEFIAWYPYTQGAK